MSARRQISDAWLPVPPPRIQGKIGKIYIQPANGKPIQVAAKTEWTLARADRVLSELERSIDDRNEGKRLTPKQEELLNQILATLVMQAGGEIVIPEAILADTNETTLIVVDEESGFVKITHIPDYVKTGYDVDTGLRGSGMSDSLMDEADHPLDLPYEEWQKQLVERVSQIYGGTSVIGFDPALRQDSTWVAPRFLGPAVRKAKAESPEGYRASKAILDDFGPK